MWFNKQGPALVYDDEHPDHMIIARDISERGHKRYGVFPRSQVDEFEGPYNELIRTHAVCRLYFDLDGVPQKEDVVEQLLVEVKAKLAEVYNIEPGQPIVLCSSNETKFSKHIVYPGVHFLNNWEHMRNFVQLIEHPLVDHSVYSRNRCFRMAGCHKFGDPERIFRPGRPSSALVCHPSASSQQ